MENELKIFKSEKFGEVDKYKTELGFGYYYGVKLGKYLKIGATSNPKQRLSQLKNLANYMNVTIDQIMISDMHVNYLENEKLIHENFSNKRIDKTELFDISCDDFIFGINNINLKYVYTYNKNPSLDMLLEGIKNSFINKPDVDFQNDNKINIFCNTFMQEATNNLLYAFMDYSERQSELINELDIMTKLN